MITVLGRTTSLNVQYVMWAIAELDLAHRREDVGGAFGGNDTPEYLAMNPNGLVPVVLVDGQALWESAAIVRYLGCAHGDERFWPRDPLVRARLDMWAEWIKTTFAPTLLTGIFRQQVFLPSDKRDPAAVAAAEATLKGLAPMVDARLAGTPWLGGEEPCFADIMLGTPLYRYYTLDFERAKTSNLDAYYQRLSTRPAYAEHVMVSYESLRAK